MISSARQGGRLLGGEMRQKGTSVEQSAAVLVTPRRKAEAPEVLRYPSSDGKPMAQDHRQLVAITSTVETLREHFRGRQDVHVRGDMFIFFRKLRIGVNPEKVSVVPDVFVVVGDVEVPQSSYKIWEVGIVPQFVMEVASKSSQRRDREDKYTIYERLGFREYWWFDPTGALQRPEDEGRALLGWRLGKAGRYEQLVAESGDLVRSDELDLGLCVVEGKLRFWDYAKQQFLSTRAELADAWAAAEQRTEAAERRAEAAELEVARLRAELARVQAKPRGSS